MLTCFDETMRASPAHTLRTYAPALILILLGSALLPLYRYQINQDAITYISIAQKYARSEWLDAVNGHAYPLISWIMAPFLITGLDPLLTAKAVNLFIGAATVIAMGAVCLQAGVSRRHALLCQMCTLPSILYFAYTIVTPDLLLSAVLLVYHYILLTPSYSRSIRCGIACGIIGGLAYLTKSYCLLFFLCHFPTVNCWYFFKNRGTGRKVIVANFLAGMIIFLAICAGWSSIISMKYGTATSSNQGSVIMSAMSPHRWEGPDHLVEPPNRTAVSIWEDPHAIFTQQRWSPFLSRADFTHWLRFIIRNLQVTLWTFFIFSPLGFCICLWHTGGILRRRCWSGPDQIAAYYLGACAIFAGGYCLLIAEERYLWPLFFIFVLMSIMSLAQLTSKRYFKNRLLYRRALLLLLCLSFTVMPAVNLYNNINTGRDSHELGQKLNTIINPGSKLVFDTKWFESLFLSFHLQSQIYGTSDNIPAEKLNSELQRCSIDYFILWEKSPAQYPFLKNAEEVSLERLHELRIFKLPHQ
jgi:hypothetical protein